MATIAAGELLLHWHWQVLIRETERILLDRPVLLVANGKILFLTQINGKT